MNPSLLFFSGQDLLEMHLQPHLAKKCIKLLQNIFKQSGITKEVCVSFVEDLEIQELNHQFRGKNKPTDVLSFNPNETHPMPGLENILGDIVISLDTALLQAKNLGHEAEVEIAILFAHGLGHLLGFDHEKSDEEAQKQAQFEQELLTHAQVTGISLYNRFLTKTDTL